jgi:hypothetical protein
MNPKQREYILKHYREKSVKELAQELSCDRKTIQRELRDILNSQEASKAASPHPRHSLPEWAFIALVLASFAAAVLATLLKHEMWRDEIVMWLIARDSHSIPEMLRVIKYGGHPSLWFLGLYGLKHLTHDPAAMQFYHYGLVVAAAFVFLKWAPFPRLLRALFLFGYFPFYEYAVKSRSYILGILLLFLCCALYRIRHKSYLGISVALFLLCQTSAVGLLIAMAFAFSLLLEIVTDRNLLRSGGADVRQLVAGAAVFVAGVANAVLQLIPPADSGFATEWNFKWWPAMFLEMLSTLRVAFFPLVRDMLFKAQALPLDGLLALLLLAGLPWLIGRRLHALIFYGTATAALLAFFYVKLLGHVWHHGHLYYIFIAGLWISSQLAREKGRSNSGGAGGMPRWAVAVTAVLMVFQVVTGLRAHGRDWKHAYSAGEAAARFIREQGLDKLPIVADSDLFTVTVVGYLDREVYYPRARRYGTYYILNQERYRPFVPENVIEAAQNLARAKKEDVIVLLNYDLVPAGDIPLGEVLPPNMKKIAEFTDSLWEDERFYIYRVTPAGP